jgi:hypothetical protein
MHEIVARLHTVAMMTMLLTRQAAHRHHDGDDRHQRAELFV